MSGRWRAPYVRDVEFRAGWGGMGGDDRGAASYFSLNHTFRGCFAVAARHRIGALHENLVVSVFEVLDGMTLQKVLLVNLKRRRPDPCDQSLSVRSETWSGSFVCILKLVGGRHPSRNVSSSSGPMLALRCSMDTHVVLAISAIAGQLLPQNMPRSKFSSGSIGSNVASEPRSPSTAAKLQGHKRSPQKMALTACLGLDSSPLSVGHSNSKIGRVWAVSPFQATEANHSVGRKGANVDELTGTKEQVFAGP